MQNFIKQMLLFMDSLHYILYFMRYLRVYISIISLVLIDALIYASINFGVMTMKNIFAKITAIAAGVNNPAQAIELNYNLIRNMSEINFTFTSAFITQHLTLF